MDTMGRIAEGFDTLELKAELKESALSNLERWLTEERFEAYEPYLLHLVEQERWDVILDSFYRMIPFGTGGRRGPVGVGPNRMNPYTLATSVQGHVRYLRSKFGDDRHLEVVIAYDVRRFTDMRGLFTGVDGPLTGMTSKDLAWQAARVYAANGVQAWILPPDSTSYVSTPELSFLIRELDAHGGLNVSASHNHPDDNGGKFYDHHGGQEVPPDDEIMARMVEEVDDALDTDAKSAMKMGLIRVIGDDLRDRYLAHNLSLFDPPVSTSAKVVFTPLHGTGSTTVLQVLERAGFDVVPVEEQLPFDGTFPTVPFRIANPEVPQSMERAVALAKAEGADLVMATDPDADRLGMMAPDRDGDWRFFTGNEIATLLLAHLLERRPREDKGMVITTWVTTSMLRLVARAAGLGLVGTLPVGFKFIAYVLRTLENQGKYEEVGWGRTVEGRADDMILGTEESHGFLVTPWIRDKDAAGAALVLAEMASVLEDRGETFQHVLDRLQLEHGVVVNRLTSVVMQGAVGLEKIARIQESLRAAPPETIGGLRVEEVIDWQDEDRFGPIRSNTDRSTRNVLSFILQGGSRVTIRPSGTEPKNKTYVEVVGRPLPTGSTQEDLARERGMLERMAQDISDGFVTDALARIGEDLPRAALRVSDLVPLEERVRVVTEVAEGLVGRYGAVKRGELSMEGLQAWLSEELAPLGSDPKKLVAEGMAMAMADLAADEVDEIMAAFHGEAG